MAVRMLGKPISRYSSRVLKTAPSQWVWGISQKVGGVCAAAGLELSALIEAKGRGNRAAARQNGLNFLPRNTRNTRKTSGFISIRIWNRDFTTCNLHSKGPGLELVGANECR